MDRRRSENDDRSEPDWLPGGLIERLGAALVAPRRALRAADQRDAAGKTGGDVALLIGVSLLALHTRELAIATWLTVAEGLRIGVTALSGTLRSAVAMDLVFVFVAGLVLTVAAGRLRSVGRDFDLACVAFVPIVFVETCTTLALRLVGGSAAGTASHVITAIAYAWAAVVLVLAFGQIRSRGRQEVSE